MSKITKYTSVLKNPHFLKLAGSHFLGQTAINMLHFILIIEIFGRTGSNLLVGILLATLSLPAVFLSYVGGIAADSFNRRRILYTVNVFRVVLAVYILFVLDFSALVLIGAFLITAANQFYLPTEGAALADVVHKDSLFRANSIFAFVFYSSFLVGYAIAGPIMEAWGFVTVFAVIILLYAGALVLNVWLPKLDDHLTQAKIRLRFNLKDIGERMREGFVFMRTHQLIWLVVWVVAIMFSIERGVISLVPAIAQKLLGFGVTEISLVMILPLAFGTVVGALIANKLKYRWSKFRMIMVGLLIDGIALLVFPFYQEVISVVRFLGVTSMSDVLLLRVYVGVVAFLSGFADVVIIVATQTLIQEETEPETRGRVLGGLQSLLNLVGLPVIIGVSALGGLSLRTFMVIAGAVVLLMFGYAMMHYRLRMAKKYLSGPS